MVVGHIKNVEDVYFSKMAQQSRFCGKFVGIFREISVNSYYVQRSEAVRLTAPDQLTAMDQLTDLRALVRMFSFG